MKRQEIADVYRKSCLRSTRDVEGANLRNNERRRQQLREDLLAALDEQTDSMKKS